MSCRDGLRSRMGRGCDFGVACSALHRRSLEAELAHNGLSDKSVFLCLLVERHIERTNQIRLLQWFRKRRRENVVRFAGICATVCTDSNYWGVGVLPVCTLDVTGSTLSVNF